MYSPPVSFIFSVFFVSVVIAKLAHLSTYATTVPLSAFLLFLPTFFLPDFLAICFLRMLLRPVRGWFTLLTAFIGFLLTFVTLGAGSSQLGFWFRTGAELEWHEAKAFASDKEQLKVLLSEAWGVLVSGGVLVVIAYFAQNLVYRLVGDFLAVVYDILAFVPRWIIRRRRGRYAAQNENQDAEAGSQFSDDDTEIDPNANEGSESHMLIGTGEKRELAKPKRFRCAVPTLNRVMMAVTVFFLTVTTFIRPKRPYTHMSVTLPVHFLDIFMPEPDHCSEQRHIMRNRFPLPWLLEKKNWEEPSQHYKGWAPGENSPLVNQYWQRRPDWLPDELPRGFLRWDPKRFDAGVPGSHGAAVEAWQKQCPGLKLEDPFYNPVNDPLKLSNLDNDVLQPLKEKLGDGSVKVKNVIFILMESLRQELFPIRSGSDIYNTIINANEEKDRARVRELLSRLTPHTEKLTGVSGGFTDSKGNPYKAPELKWNDTTEPDHGGVNVVGSYSMASLSTKSFGSSHCGVWPLPVENFDEADTDAYQPCITQIMDLWNRQKAENATRSEDDFTTWPWHPALMEAEVEQFDRQEVFDQKLGFKHIICRKQVEEDTTRYNKSDPLYKEVNYFGLAEPVLKPYIRDYITNATANKQRIWMSHFTSTTHHPWNVPDWFKTENYLPIDGSNSWHTDFNKYLNTIRYHDQWLGELMQLLDDLKISNETLIVFAGDHGQAFKEDYHKLGTYEVGHLSAFRVPIVFRHPKLPRVQYEVNGTSLSIVPTILDLLINSGSLDEKDSHVATDLIQDYEGQSLIRPYKKEHNGRRAWNFHVINIGAGMMAVTSADVQWRLVMPLDKMFEYVFTDTKTDPEEKNPTTAWSLHKLEQVVDLKYGREAARWAREAVEVARWHRLERERLWRWHLIKT